MPRGLMRFESRLLTAARPKKVKEVDQIQVLAVQLGELPDLKKVLGKMGLKGVCKDFDIPYREETFGDEEEEEGAETLPTEQVAKIHNMLLTLPGVFFVWFGIKDYLNGIIFYQVAGLPQKPEGFWDEDPADVDSDESAEVQCGTKQDLIQYITYAIGEGGSDGEANPMDLDDQALIERQKMKRKR